MVPLHAIQSASSILLPQLWGAASQRRDAYVGPSIGRKRASYTEADVVAPQVPWSFSISVAGRVCLDAGAAAGGFTDCMLQCSARLIYAVDAGYGQLRGRIANDPRVVSMKRMNISDVRADQLDPGVEFSAIDLSYLSLTKRSPLSPACSPASRLIWFA